MGESIVLFVAELGRVIVGVEYYALLDGVNVFAMNHVFADRELLNAEVLSQSVPDEGASMLSDAAVIEVKFNHGFVVQDKLGEAFCALVSDVIVPEVQILHLLISHQILAKFLDLIAVNLCVRHIEQLDPFVFLKHNLEELEVLRSNVVLAYV